MECNEGKSHLSRHIQQSEDDRKKQRKRNLALLVLQYLRQNGYLNAAIQLQFEVGNCLDNLELCDNVSLEYILQDFEAYYFLRYQNYIQISKKVTKDENKDVKVRKSRPKLVISPNDISKTSNKQEIIECSSGPIHPLGPYSHLELNNEWRLLAEMVNKEILVKDSSVTWNDVIGHESVKQSLKESLIYSMKYPDLYSVVKPWRGLFLYGPTGTGKTMLAKAAANECKATFFVLTPSTFISKWRGESEKMIKVLFDLAIAHAPSVIFLDEVDSLMTRRFTNEHEASRRFKSELLAQIEGLKTLEESVFLFVTSNFPWDLDFAMLRRMEQRVYAPLPNCEERETMFRKFLPTKISSLNVNIETKLDYTSLAVLTDGYSGSDLKLVAKEVMMDIVRHAVQSLESSESSSLVVPVIDTKNVLKALSKIKPVHLPLMKEYEDFSTRYATT